MDHYGKVEQLYFPSSMREELANNMKSIIASSQVVLDKKKRKQWQTKEKDLNGTPLIAQYKTKDTRIYKTRVRYEGEMGKWYKIKHSAMIVDFDLHQGHYKNLELKEELEASPMGTFFTSQKSLKIALLKKERHQEKFNAGVLTHSTKTTLKGGGEKEFKKQRWHRILGKETFASLQKNLQGPQNPKRNYELFRKFVALMQLYPKKINAVTKIVLNETPGSHNMSLLLAALSKVEHKQAQQGLREIVEKSAQIRETLFLALPALGSVKKPTAESVAVLKRFTQNTADDDVHNSAILALGSVAENVQAPTGIIYDLINELKQNSSSEKTIVYLQALGNSTNPIALSGISSYLANENESLRAVAVRSLGEIKGKKATSLLAQRLLLEKSSTVKKQVLLAIFERPAAKETYEALVNTIAVEKSPQLRIREAAALWKMKSKFSNAKAIVQNLANSDPSPIVRKAIENFMLAE